MNYIGTIQLEPSTILNVPLQTFSNDFTFVVNGKEIKTSRIIADLLSPIICRIHSNDPTFNRFIINTQHQGDFSHIIELITFHQINISSNEVGFVSEIIEILRNGSINYEETIKTAEITLENVISLVSLHEQYNLFNSNRFSTEIEFIASHFYELFENREDEFARLSIDTLFKIVRNDHFQLNSEDELLHFVNSLYSRDRRFCDLYECVIFSNVTSKTMTEFVDFFDINDINGNIWSAISSRFKYDIILYQEETHSFTSRYRERKSLEQPRGESFEYSQGKEFKGIINHLTKESNGHLENEVIITSSSASGGAYLKPKNVALFDDQTNYFQSKNTPNSWLSFDFKNHRVIPSAYTIRSFPSGPNAAHPRSWVIEGSNDADSWEVLDEQNNCAFLNGKGLVHTFTMNHQNENEFKFIRMRLTGTDWYGCNFFIIDSFELFGRLI